jgi:hypothetical protein
MSSVPKMLTGAVAGIALVTATTAAAAQPTSAPVAAATSATTTPSVKGQIQNPWLALSMMNPTAAVALGGAAAAAQPDVPPPPPQYNNGFQAPPIPVLVIWAAWLALFIWIVSKNNNHGHFRPVSPD